MRGMFCCLKLLTWREQRPNGECKDGHSECAVEELTQLGNAHFVVVEVLFTTMCVGDIQIMFLI